MLRPLDLSNLDPFALFGCRCRVRRTTFDVVSSFGSDPNWACSTASHSPQHVFDIDGLFYRPKRRSLNFPRKMAAAKATKNSIICYFGPLLRFGKTETQGYGPSRVGVLRRTPWTRYWKERSPPLSADGRPLRTFEEFRAWLATASGRRAMRRRIGD